MTCRVSFKSCSYTAGNEEDLYFLCPACEKRLGLGAFSPAPAVQHGRGWRFQEGLPLMKRRRVKGYQHAENLRNVGPGAEADKTARVVRNASTLACRTISVFRLAGNKHVRFIGENNGAVTVVHACVFSKTVKSRTLEGFFSRQAR